MRENRGLDINFKKHLVEKNILWKSKATVGDKRGLNYSIKDRVRNTLLTWTNLREGHEVEGREVCDLIQLISSKFLNIIKKEHKKNKSKMRH